MSDEVEEPILRCKWCDASFTLPEALDATDKMQCSWEYFTADCPRCKWQMWLCQDEDRPESLSVGELYSYGARPDVTMYQMVKLPAALEFDGAGGITYRGRKWSWRRDSVG
jgi:hypothetical protein